VSGGTFAEDQRNQFHKSRTIPVTSSEGNSEENMKRTHQLHLLLECYQPGGEQLDQNRYPSTGRPRPVEWTGGPRGSNRQVSAGGPARGVKEKAGERSLEITTFKKKKTQSRGGPTKELKNCEESGSSRAAASPEGEKGMKEGSTRKGGILQMGGLTFEREGRHLGGRGYYW